MSAAPEQDPQAELDAMKKAIREVAHDISNPLGILRMAVYYLETAKPEEEKRDHYYKVIAQTLDKIEASLKRLRSLTGYPGAGQEIPPSSPPTGA